MRDEMICRPENLLLFYSALPETTELIDAAVDSILREKLDWDYLFRAAEQFGETAGLAGLLRRHEGVADIIIGRLDRIACREKLATDSMLSLFDEVSLILSEGEFDFIPLKGCDPRIAEGSRRLCNAMTDIDILVRLGDTGAVGMLLEERGFIYQGLLSGAHMNFFTDETEPRFIEIHWDLINRYNPLHRALFFPDIDAVWERSAILNGVRLLSEEDLLAYLTAHAVKEYFNSPKWLSDIAWIVGNRLGLVDPEVMNSVSIEWGVSYALGVVAEALDNCLHNAYIEQLMTFGVKKPGVTGRYVARRVLCYDQLRSLRPFLYAAAAGSPLRTVHMLGGAARRLFQKMSRERF